MKRKNIYYLIILFGLFACDKDDDNAENEQSWEFNYSFTSSTEGWIGDFADKPPGEEDFYELEFEHSGLPEPLDGSNGALKLSGNNHSDDLFMFIKKQLTGLTPKQGISYYFQR